MEQLLNHKLLLRLSMVFVFFFFLRTVNAQDIAQQNRVYIKIEIKGMACPYCAFGMEKKLKKISGVANVTIVLKKGLAYISTPINQKPTKELLKKIIIDSGFTVGEIVFQDTPFLITKEKKE
ncbi:MAG: heavy-metal-associated domain-containing protein [Flavobacteriaceae bacterium]|nr:heavy-metal-associated domain-containing protein [Flavobacteriaceae bacterium]